MSGVEITSLRKSYGTFEAVKGIDLGIADGEFLVLLGPSGCGKTTTLRCIAGLEEVSGGTIAMDGRIVSSEKESVPPERRQIGMVFQSYAIWPHMSVAENVAFGLRLQKVSKEDIARRVKRVLDMVGLGSYADRGASRLSGGQQQRVALARALVLEPQVLLFDEPLSNLDAKLREEMRFELKRMVNEVGTTAVYVTHDQQEALVMANRVVLMNGGLIEQVAPPKEVYLRPASLFAAQFVGLANVLGGAAQGEGAQTRVTDGDGRVFIAATKAPAGPVDIMFRPETVIVSDVAPAAPNSFEAVVEETYFLGNFTEAYLRLGTHRIRAQTSTNTTLSPGAKVWLTVPPEAVLVYPRA